MKGRNIKILLAKPGLDGHDRGVKIVARSLRDAGFDVLYTGLHQTPEMIVNTAIDEDVDCIGLSILSGAHIHLFSKVLDLLKKECVTDKMIFGGGIIPAEDIAILKEMGIAELFTPGTSTEDIVSFVKKYYLLF